jgi:hypothetical protein
MTTHVGARRRGEETFMTVVLAVLAAVCGALLTSAVQPHPQWNLVGAGVAAAVPPLITAAGPRPGIRVATALVITVGAIAIAYGGLGLLSYTANKDPILPPIPGIPVLNRGGSGQIQAGKSSVAVSPEAKLQCHVDRCDQQVSVQNIGESALKIGAITFSGEDKADFSRTEACENQVLASEATCVFDVRFTPSGSFRDRHTKLTINHSAEGGSWEVDLEGIMSGSDLSASTKGLSCSFDHGVLKVWFPIAVSGAKIDDGKRGVHVVATSSSGLGADYRSPIAAPGKSLRSTVMLKPTATQFGRAHVVLVNVDPDDEFAETNEGNNRFTVIVTLGKFGSKPGFTCRI